MAQTGPIFIHSLFRCASTFFFQKFRALGARFTCYQEPFNESLEALNRSARHSRLLDPPDGACLLHHPQLDKPYFFEFWQRRQQLRNLYRRAFAYQEYFTGATLPAPQQRWIAALLAHARGRAVLQFCRSSGRATALRAAFGGTHLHLWREPRAQWWSYKIADYFDSVSRRIYEARNLPPPLAQLRNGLPGRDGAVMMSARHNYALYYGLWLHAWLALSDRSDASISVDRIALDEAANRACAARLTALLDERMDLSDIRPSGMAFAPEELPFYESIEQRVGELFISSGHASGARVRSAESAAAHVRLAHARRAHDILAERNLRQAALTMMDCMQPGRWGPRQGRDASGGTARTPLLGMLQRIWPLLAGPSETDQAGRPGKPYSDAPLLPAVGAQSARSGYHRD